MAEPEDEKPAAPETAASSGSLKRATKLSPGPLLFVLAIAASIAFVLSRGERTVAPEMPASGAPSVDEPPELKEKLRCLSSCNKPCTEIKDTRRRYDCLTICDASCQSPGKGPPPSASTRRD